MHHPVRTHWPAQQAPQLQSGGIYLSRLKHQDTHQVVVHGTSQPHVHAIYCHRSNPECWACRTATIDPPTWLNEQGVGDSTGPHTRLPAVNCVVTVANGRRQAQSRMRRTVAEAAATRTAPRCIRCSRAGVPRLLAGATLSARCALLNAIPKQVLAPQLRAGTAAAASWYDGVRSQERTTIPREWHWSRYVLPGQLQDGGRLGWWRRQRSIVQGRAKNWHATCGLSLRVRGSPCIGPKAG
jgi:hypothetical protein